MRSTKFDVGQGLHLHQRGHAGTPSLNEVTSTAAPGHGAWGRLREPSHGTPWSDVRRVVRGHISVCVRLSKESDVAEPGDQRRRGTVCPVPNLSTMDQHERSLAEAAPFRPRNRLPATAHRLAERVAKSQSATRKTHRKAHTVLPRNVEVNPLCTGRQRRRCRVKFTKSIMHGPCTM